MVAQLDMAPQTAAIQSEDGDKHVNIFSVDIQFESQTFLLLDL